MKFIVSPHLPTTKLEPYPRSAARAKRRAARGYPQHHRMVPDQHAYRIGDTLILSQSAFDEIKSNARHTA